MITHLLTALFSTLLFIGRVSAAPPSELATTTGRFTEKVPVIDGRADESAWIPASEIPVPAGQPRLLWDRESLYFFIDLPSQDTSAAFNDHWSLSLRPSEAHSGSFVFTITPDGSLRSAFSAETEVPPASSNRRGGGLRAEAKVVVRTTASATRTAAWTIEGRIPWINLSAVGGRPAPGEIWLARTRRGADTPPTDFFRIAFAGPEPLARARWTNTRLMGSPDGPQGYRTRRAWPQLGARSLVGLTPTPTGDAIWFIEQEGGREGHMRLRHFRAAGDGSDAETFFELEEMAYSFAFHPRFAENGYVYLGVNGPRAAPPRSSQVVRYTVRAGRPDPATRAVVIAWPSDGHNGAALAFANDGRLFVTSGDGTSRGDGDNVGQDPRSLRAKILRLDIDHPAAGKRYSVPPDNPFVNDPRFAPETWAYGLRNPWRLTYDALSEQLWSGENGQDAWEYARLVERGANYGWPTYEGAHLFGKNRPLGPHPVTFPTLEFSHAEFRSLTGGIVYRGQQFPELIGAYVFGDFGTGRVWAARHHAGRLEWTRELIDTPFGLTHVTADAAGEILLVDYGVERQRGPGGGGTIHRLERAPPPTGPLPEFPRRLSDTGLFANVAELVPSPGVIPYTINAPAWHDGASSTHHLALPGDAQVEFRPSKSWQLPDGAALVQTLSLAGRRLETRILLKQENDFAGYSYVWNEAQTDATLVEKTGADLTLASGQPWRLPSRAECMMCHSREANFALTLQEAQLNHEDQLARWERLGLLHVAPPIERGRRGREGAAAAGLAPVPQRTAAISPLLLRAPHDLRKFATPTDPHASLEQRARSYLAVNCAHCHTVNGGGNSAMNFDPLLPLERMRAINERPQHGDLNLPDARVIAPGAAGRSVIIPRIALRGPHQMPPVGTRTGDPANRIADEWVNDIIAARFDDKI